MISYVTHTYNNPAMVEAHTPLWLDIQQRGFETILVDDCSLPVVLPGPYRLLKITNDIMWNQAGARNLGVVQATGDWVFITDIDHFVTADFMEDITKAELDPHCCYSFKRWSIEKNCEIHPHVNTFLFNKETFVRYGGYDRDFIGGYGFEDVWFIENWLSQGGRTAQLNYAVSVKAAGATQGLSRDRSRNKAILHAKRTVPFDRSNIEHSFAWEEIS